MTLEKYASIEVWDALTGAWYEYKSFATLEQAREYVNDPTVREWERARLVYVEEVA